MPPPNLPFAQINLRWNPFRELTIEEWMQLSDVDEVSKYVEQLTDPLTVLQFTGGKGYGKTSHLLAVRAAIPTSVYLHIPEGERRSVPDGSPLLIDEAQRLTWSQRRTVFRERRSLVLGTHRDFEAVLSHCGRRVTTLNVETSVTTDRLHRIFNARISMARRAEGPVPQVSEATAKELRIRFGSNVRRMIHELYLNFQDLREVAVV